MFDRLADFRRSTRWLSPALGLVLLAGAVVLGVHQHRDGADHGACVACSASHAPAIVVDAAPAPGGFPALDERPLATPRLAPRAATRVATSPRAPPLA